MTCRSQAPSPVQRPPAAAEGGLAHPRGPLVHVDTTRVRQDSACSWVQPSTVCAPAALQILPLSHRDGDRRHVDSVTVGPWDSLACMLTQAPSLADQMILLLFVCSLASLSRSFFPSRSTLMASRFCRLENTRCLRPAVWEQSPGMGAAEARRPKRYLHSSKCPFSQCAGAARLLVSGGTFRTIGGPGEMQGMEAGVVTAGQGAVVSMFARTEHTSWHLKTCTQRAREPEGIEA